jgi:hypothetical protein
LILLIIVVGVSFIISRRHDIQTFLNPFLNKISPMLS